MAKNAFFSFKKGDLLAIALVVMLAATVAAAYIPVKNSAVGGMAQVYQDGTLLKELPLDINARFEVDGDYFNTVVVEDGRVSIGDSDCPGRDCVHSGWISSPGRSIVCLPNRVEIRITGQSEVDFVVGN